MPDPIISIDRIEAQARQAAALYSDINDACPYPFGTEAARVFARAFRAAVSARNNVPALANTGDTAMKGIAQ